MAMQGGVGRYNLERWSYLDDAPLTGSMSVEKMDSSNCRELFTLYPIMSGRDGPSSNPVPVKQKRVRMCVGRCVGVWYVICTGEVWLDVRKHRRYRGV